MQSGTKINRPEQTAADLVVNSTLSGELNRCNGSHRVNRAINIMVANGLYKYLPNYRYVVNGSLTLTITSGGEVRLLVFSIFCYCTASVAY